MPMLEGVPEVLRPLLPELAVSLGEYLVQAGQALARGDSLVAAEAAHAVKGAAMYYKLPAMADAAAKFEAQCRMLAGGDISAKALERARQALAAAGGELEALRAELKA